MSAFRLQAKNLFLTYPQCPITKQQALAQLLAKVQQWQPSVILVACELHSDGHQHLHAAIQLTLKCRIRAVNRLDLVSENGTNYHGNYQAARNWKNTLLYVTKEDSEPATHGIPDLVVFLAELRKKKNSKLALVAKRFLDDPDTDIHSLCVEMPEMLWRVNQMKDMQAFCRAKKRTSHMMEWNPISIDGLNPSSMRVATWLNLNLFQERAFKQPQMWIHGPPNHGKTSLIAALQKYCRVYVVPLTENWDDNFDDNDIDLVVFDEFKAQRQITWMNGFTDGSTFPVSRRGCAPFLKTKNLPCLVLSNYDISGAYNNRPQDRLAPLLARFEIVDLGTEIFSDTLFDLIQKFQ